MSARQMYRILRRMDRIAVRLNRPEVRGACMNLCWLEWMGRFSDAMEKLPRPVYIHLADSAEMEPPYVAHLPALLAASREA